MREKLDAVLLACIFDDNFRNSLNEDCPCFFRVLNDLINDDDSSASWIEIYETLVKEDACFLEPYIEFVYCLLENFY